ncbi:MAG: type II toxin-antitoxin system prevent-host-death family antitoxin [Alphaproteobacteria bacterium]|nr:type II toxin-antitoxin system prevent-host-death family antitoxin [Alphaproteobacteria bacterium]
METTVADRRIAAGKLKAECLKLLDEVAAQRRPYVITKRGKPVARLVPLDPPSKDIFGCMKGTVRTVGDIVSPVDVEWEADTERSRRP